MFTLLSLAMVVDIRIGSPSISVIVNCRPILAIFKMRLRTRTLILYCSTCSSEIGVSGLWKRLSDRQQLFFVTTAQHVAVHRCAK